MSVLRWMLSLLLVFAALVIASLTAGPDSWHRAVEWARQWRTDSPTAKPTCPVLVGAPLPGDARSRYARAAELARAIDIDDRQALRAVLDKPAPSAAEAMAIVARLPAKALAEQSRAARTSGNLQFARRLGGREQLPLIDFMALCDALLVTARYAETAELRVDAWLDALACGWDFAGMEVAVGELYGLMIVERSLAIADDAWLRSLSPECLAQLATALAKVDAAAPLVSDLQTQVASMVLLVEEADDLQPHDIGLRSIYETWENLFSVKDAAIERVALLDEQVKAFCSATPPNEIWPAREARLKDLVLADEQANPDLAFNYLHSVLRSEQERRRNVTRMRLLRMAVAHLRGDELALMDPFDEVPLSVAQGDGFVQFCSVETGLTFRLENVSEPASRGR